MEPIAALGITGAVVALAAVVGALWRVTTGRRRTGDGTVFGPQDLPGLEQLGDGATLVQFSTEYCAICPATRRFLQQVAAERGGVRHHEIDLTNDPQLANQLKILQTPTVFVLDRDGRLTARFGGAPRRDELYQALDPLVPEPEWNL